MIDTYRVDLHVDSVSGTGKPDVAEAAAALRDPQLRDVFARHNVELVTVETVDAPIAMSVQHLPARRPKETRFKGPEVRRWS